MAATDRRETESGIEVKPVYTAEDAAAALEPPGEFPYTRGPYRDMYRGRPWTVRQYAGFASAEESNARYRYLLAHGQTGLSIAFDLPTQLGIAKPYWVERHGDAEVDGFGPYEPPIGMRQGIPAGSARAAGRVLDRHVRAAVDDCLKQSER